MPTRRCCLLICLAATILAAEGGDELLGGAPAKGPNPASGQNAATEDSAPDDRQAALRKAQANGLTSQGMESVRRFNADKTRNATAIVDAAILFSKARELLSASQDIDAIAQVQANLYWCRKQMDADTIKTYLTQKGDDGKRAQKAMDAVATIAVPSEQAKTYLASADTWAKAHADDHLQIAIRFLEIAERFPATSEGTEANKRALDAQQSLMKSLAQAADEARRTRFMKAQPAPAGAANPIPDAASQKECLALLRKTFAKDYQKTQAADKARLARKLLAEAAKNRKDAVVYHGMLTETVRLAGEGEDYVTLLDAIDRLGEAFTGVDAVAEKKTVLKRVGKPIAHAIAKLIETPDDAASNLAAGKWFCFAARRWNEGLPMLVNGGDPAIAKVTQMEMDKPQNAEERLLVADAWYDLGKKTTGKDDKLGMMTRSLFWYQEAVKDITGLAKDRITGRMAEIDKLLPIDIDSISWDTLTAGQWEKLKGKSFTVAGKFERVDPNLTLTAGQKIRIVPCPADTWTFDGTYIGKRTVDWHGWDGRDRSKDRHFYFAIGAGNFPLGALLCWLGNGDKQVAGELTGPGKLYLGCAQSNDWNNLEWTGQIVLVKRIPDSGGRRHRRENVTALVAQPP